jgi:hypothetical protein
MRIRLAVLAAVVLFGSGGAFGQGVLHTIQSPNGSFVCQIMDPTATNRYQADIRFSNVAHVLSAMYNGKEFLQCDSPLTNVDTTPGGHGGDGGLAMEFDLGENSMPPGNPATGGTLMNQPPGVLEAVTSSSKTNTASWFLMIGVGVLSKNQSGNYAWGHDYPVVNRGDTTVTWSSDRAHFVQETTGTPANGYAYRLEEDVIASDGVLTMNYKLKNTGTKYFRTDQFNHNFLAAGSSLTTLDQDSTHYEVQAPFALQGTGTVMDIVGPGYWRYSTAQSATMTWASLGGWDKPFIFPPAGSHGNWLIVRNRTQGQALVCAMSLENNWTSIYTNTGGYKIAPEQNTPISLNPGQEVSYSRTYVFSTFTPGTVEASRLASAVPLDQTHLQAVFSLPVNPTTASALSNYALNAGTTISAIAMDPGNLSVTLTTSPLAGGTTYTLTASGVRDFSGSLISPNPGTASFTVPGSMLPPGVAITSPTSTYVAAPGSTVALTATASTADPSGSITAVQFYDGASLLGAGTLASGTSSSGTWTYAWNTTGTPEGLHNLTAKATDNSARQTTSSPATVVNVVTYVNPNVAITLPTGVRIAGRGHWVAFAANAWTTNAGGSIVSVEFYDGATKLGDGGTIGNGVYNYEWTTSGATFGMHHITAKATDNGGRTTVSAEALVQIRVLGDGNGDGTTDGLDYGIWQAGYQRPGALFTTGDYNNDGAVDGLDYGVWQAYYQNHGTYSEDTPTLSAAASSAATAPAGATTPTGQAPRLVATMPAPGAAARGVTSLVLTFDSTVTVGAGAVEVYGAATGDHSDCAAAYDPATRTLTLTWAAPLPADAYTVRVVSDFVVGGGGTLDGEVSDPADAAALPSGDGAAGGDAVLEFVAK